MSREVLSVAAGWRGCVGFEMLISRFSSWWMRVGKERDIIERVFNGWCARGKVLALVVGRNPVERGIFGGTYPLAVIIYIKA